MLNSLLFCKCSVNVLQMFCEVVEPTYSKIKICERYIYLISCIFRRFFYITENLSCNIPVI